MARGKDAPATGGDTVVSSSAERLIKPRYQSGPAGSLMIDVGLLSWALSASATRRLICSGGILANAELMPPWTNSVSPTFATAGLPITHFPISPSGRQAA